MCMCDQLYGYECVLWKESLVEAQICHLPTATLDAAMEGDSMNEDTFAACLAPTLHRITIGALQVLKCLKTLYLCLLSKLVLTQELAVSGAPPLQTLW